MMSKKITLTGGEYCNYRTMRQSYSNPDEWYSTDDHDKSYTHASKCILSWDDAGMLTVTMSQNKQECSDTPFAHTTKRFKMDGDVSARKSINYSDGLNWRITAGDDRVKFNLVESSERGQLPAWDAVFIDVCKTLPQKEWDYSRKTMVNKTESYYLYLKCDYETRQQLDTWFRQLVADGKAKMSREYWGSYEPMTEMIP